MKKSLGNKCALLYSPDGSMCALRGRQPGQPNVRAVSDCQKTTALSLRDSEGVVAISQNNLASCMYSGEYETFLLDCHVASLLAMTCRGLFRHAETARTAKCPGCLASLRSVQGSASLALPQQLSQRTLQRKQSAGADHFRRKA